MSFLIDLNEGGGALCRLDVGKTLYGAHRAATTDQLFVGDETGFSEFANGKNLLEYEWHSGESTFAKPQNFAAGVVDAVGVATLTVYEGTNVRATVSVSNRTYFRIQPGKPGYRWSVKVVGNATVREISLGMSFAELKGA